MHTQHLKQLKHPSHPIPRPTPRLRQALYVATLLVLLSGLGWLVAHYWLPLPEFAARHPLETWSLRLHGAAAMFALMVFGAVWQQHLGYALRQRRYLPSGSALLGAWLGLIGSGYGLYYLTDEALRASLSLGHWLLGLALPIALFGHIAHAIKKRRR